MITAGFAIRDRGATPRGMKKAHNAASKQAWFDTGVQHHAENTDKRFTRAHATLAGYAPRKKSYEMRKLRAHGHTRPLEWSGTARRLVKTANITSTSGGARVRYPGARVFNFRNPHSLVNAAEEFTFVTSYEADQLARFYDDRLDRGLNQNQDSN